jgi:hypothetical protein
VLVQVLEPELEAVFELEEELKVELVVLLLFEQQLD